MRCRAPRVRQAGAALLMVYGGVYGGLAETHVPSRHDAASVTAFVNVAVVPMDRARVLPHQTVLITGHRITALGPVARMVVPAGAQRIDGRGKFLLPGLADMHAHLRGYVHVGNAGVFPVTVPRDDSIHLEDRLFLWLANGVTTVRNVDYFGDFDFTYAGDPYGTAALRLRARSVAGDEWLPHIYTAGQWAPRQYIGFARAGDPPPVMDSVLPYVRAYKAKGYDVLKIHEESPAMVDAVLAAARHVGMPAVGHVPPPTRVEHILPRGYRSIEHPLTEYLWAQRTNHTWSDTTGIGTVAAMMRRFHVWHCPTQAHYDKWHEAEPSLLAVERDSGVAMLLGTDELPWQGVITRELQAMVAAGLTPYQALLTGTRNVADYFGTARERGTIAVGKQADLVLLDGNPLADVRYTAQPAGVMLGGRWLDRPAIAQRLAHITLPTFDPVAQTLALAMPIKSYWQNVLDEATATMTGVLNGATLPESLVTAQARRRAALVDSIGMSTHYAASTTRVYQLIAEQLGVDRSVLTAEQRTSFDANVGVWVHQRRKQGINIHIRGMP